MKRIYLISLLISSAIVLMSNKFGRAAGEGQGSTGAPGEPTVCKNCHNGNIVVGVNLYVIDGTDTVKSYEAEKTYSIHVVVNPISGPVPKGFGFQLTALNAALKADGPAVKNFTAKSSNVKISTISGSDRVYAEQNGNSSTNTFVIEWKAPVKGSGPISFYSAVNGNNANNSDSGDGSSKISQQFNEKVVTSNLDTKVQELKIFPNPGPGLYHLNGKDIDIVKNIELFNLIGNSIFAKLYHADDLIDLSSLNDGIYLLQLKDLNGKVIRTQKLFKVSEKP